MEEVTLGEAVIPVYPQRVSYLTNRTVPAVIEVLESARVSLTDIADTDIATVVRRVGYEGVYDLLVSAAPSIAKRLPKYTFCGFASQEAMDADEYDEDAAADPTLDEIVEAFKVVARVNGLDSVVSVGKLLGKAIDPRLLRAEVSLALAGFIGSRSSQPQSGESPSTSSTPTSPTPTESEGSPSPASTD